jgi:glutaredoxin 3
MTEVTLYSTRTCAYCIAAKRLLGARGVAYDEIDVSTDAEKRAWLVEKTGQRTVPQIFIRGESIGGYQELASLDNDGRLQQMLGGSAGETGPATRVGVD